MPAEAALGYSERFDRLIYIYPAGMKIAAGWGADLPWEQVTVAVSALAAGGGALTWRLLPDGPHLPAGAPFNPRARAIILRSRWSRASACGYFGRMRELYAL